MSPNLSIIKYIMHVIIFIIRLQDVCDTMKTVVMRQ